MDIASDIAFNPSSPLTSRASTPTPGAAKSRLNIAEVVPTSSKVAESSGATPHDGDAVDLTASNEKVVEGSPGGVVADSEEADSAIVGGSAALEKQAGEVVQQLSSWGNSLWGGLRKQSAQAYDAVKKDISRTVKEAQEDLERIQKQTVEVVVKDPNASSGPPVTTLDKGKGRATEADELTTEDSTTDRATTAGGTGVHMPTSASDFFAQLQSTVSNVHLPTNMHLPANLNLSSVQKTLSDTIASNPHLANLQDIGTLRTTLTDNIQKNLANSGVTLKQAERIAEDYLKRSEILLSEAGDFLKDAVKIVPPSEGGNNGGGVSWDGSDMYAFTTIPSISMSTDSATGNNKSQTLFDSATAGSRSKSSETIRLSRKDALLRRLRSDKELFLLDPSSPNETQNRRDAFDAFVKTEIEGKGGVEGEALTKSTWDELGPDGKDVEALKQTRDDLVPSRLNNEVFWTRYFFHKHMIGQEEDRRQMLLQATDTSGKDDEDDFSWDADEEEPRSPGEATLRPGSTEPSGGTTDASSSSDATPSGSSAKVDAAGAQAFIPSGPTPTTTTAHGKSTTTSTNNSPRASEESYDVVSDQPGSGSGGSSGDGPRSGGSAIPAPSGSADIAGGKDEVKKGGSDGAESDDDWE